MALQGPETTLSVLCRVLARVSPRQGPGGLILLPLRFPWCQHHRFPARCLERGSTLVLVGWGFRPLLWPWGAGCAC